MNHRILIILSVIICFSVRSFAGNSEWEMLFVDNWRFSLQDKKGAENPEYADANWRILDLTSRRVN